jgi:hypothetical protein
MPHDPADVRGAEIRFAGPRAEDVGHRGGERDRVTPGVALHALGLARGAAGVEDVRRLVGFEPRHGQHRAHMLFPRLRVVDVAAGRERHRRVDAAVDDDDVLRRRAREAQRLVDQRLEANHLAHAHAGVARDQHLGLRIVDPRGEAHRGEAAEHHRVDRAQAHRREHREHRLGRHRHVDEDAVALAHAELAQDRREAVDLGMELRVGEDAFLVDLRGDPHERILVAARLQMTIDGVVAEVGLAADEPFAERRLGVLENLAEGLVPVDAPGLLGPEALGILERARMEFLVGRHGFLAVDVDDEAAADLAGEDVGRARDRFGEPDVGGHGLEHRMVELA